MRDHRPLSEASLRRLPQLLPWWPVFSLDEHVRRRPPPFAHSRRALTRPASRRMRCFRRMGSRCSSSLHDQGAGSRGRRNDPVRHEASPATSRQEGRAEDVAWTTLLIAAPQAPSPLGRPGATPRWTVGTQSVGRRALGHSRARPRWPFPGWPDPSLGNARPAQGTPASGTAERDLPPAPRAGTGSPCPPIPEVAPLL